MIPEGGLFNDAIAARLVTQTESKKKEEDEKQVKEDEE